jgi:polyisoprenyl-phosphate glycosyltransferase
VQLISIGVLGEYTGQIFLEAKNRPLYLIDEIVEVPPHGGKRD